MNPVRSKILNQSADSQSANRTSSGMKTIAVDIDDVLAANAKAFIDYTNKKWGTNLTFDDYDEHWAKVWQVEHDEEKRRVNEFYASGAFKNYKHFPEAILVLKVLAKKYRLVIITSRQRILDKDTTDWIDKYFAGIFSELHFSGIWEDWSKNTSEKIKYTKAEVCQQIGADYLIDDQIKHCIAVAQAGIQSLLFGDYRWNQTSKRLPSNVARVKNWDEVGEYFSAKS